MVDYGRNLIGNIKVKIRSSGGDFVDMGKTKSDIDKNIREMEKLVDEIKADPEHSSDSGKMINDLKEDIRKLKLIKYDSQGKPTEESLMGIYGKDVKNAKFKDKDGTLFEVSQYPNGAWFYEIFDSNGHRIGDVGPFRYEDDAVVALKRHNSTVRKVGNINIRTKTAGGKSVSIGDTEGQIKVNIEIYKNSKKDYERKRDQYQGIVDWYRDDLKKLNGYKEGTTLYIKSVNESVSNPVVAKNTAKILERRIKDNEKEVDYINKLISNMDSDIKAMEEALKKVKTGNKNVVTLKSIPKRIDLDKKSDLEKAIKDIEGLMKDYEHGINVNEDDKYMQDNFKKLLKEANEEMADLKKKLKDIK